MDWWDFLHSVGLVTDLPHSISRPPTDIDFIVSKEFP
jgi:hypothetical protein